MLRHQDVGEMPPCRRAKDRQSQRLNRAWQPGHDGNPAGCIAGRGRASLLIRASFLIQIVRWAYVRDADDGILRVTRVPHHRRSARGVPWRRALMWTVRRPLADLMRWNAISYQDRTGIALAGQYAARRATWLSCYHSRIRNVVRPWRVVRSRAGEIDCQCTPRSSLPPVV